MTQPTPFKQFKPLGVVDVVTTLAEVDKFAKEQNIPSVVFPSDPAKPQPEPVTTAPAKAPRKGSAPAPTRRLAFDCPDYLFLDIAKDAARTGVTKRHIVLSALKGAGYDIKDIDLQEDGRRDR